MVLPVSYNLSDIDWWNGTDYHNHSSGQYGLANHLIDSYSFKEDETVLDVGCGDGVITQRIGELKIPKGTIIGLDHSKSMIDCANSQNKQKNVSFVKVKAESFYFDDQFDTILSFSALHWISDQEAVWKNIRSHLKIGGRVIVSLNPLPRSKHLTKAIDEATRMSEYANYFVGFVEKAMMPEMNIEQYRSIVLNSGLNIVECKQSIKFFEYEHAEAFALSLKAWLPHVASLPEEKKIGFVKEIAAKFGSQPKLDYNNFTIHAVRNN